MLREISKKKLILEMRKSINEEKKEFIRESTVIDLIYNIGIFENREIDIEDIRLILTGEIIPEQTLERHVEIKAFSDIIEWIEEDVAFNQGYNKKLLSHIHETLFKNIEDATKVGEFRRRVPIIKNLRYVPPQPEEINQRMNDLLEWMNTKDQLINPIRKTIKSFIDLYKIYPYDRGNEKLAVIFLNYELLKLGYPMITFKIEDKTDFFKALDEACLHENYEAFEEIIFKMIRETLAFHLLILEEQ